MTPDLAGLIYDGVIDGWREAPLRGGEHHCRCPLHDDEDPSLRIRVDGLVWYCDPCGQGGGAIDLARLVLGRDGAAQLLRKLDPRSNGRPRSEGAATPRRVTEYLYTDRMGEPLRRKVRWEPGFDGRDKSFSWEKSQGRGGWIKCGRGEGNPGVLYRLSEVMEADDVHAHEGEKAADRAALASPAGVAHTCLPAGDSLTPEMLDVLRGKRVTIWADRDAAGRTKAAKRYHQLIGVASSVLVVQAAVEAEGADAHDHLEAGHPIDAAIPVAPADLRGRELRQPAAGLDGALATTGADPRPAPQPSEPKVSSAEEQGAAFKTTDLSNAYRIAGEFGENLRWVEGLGWIVWTGERWEMSETKAIAAVSRLGRVIQREAADVSRKAAEAPESERERLSKIAEALLGWARKSESAARIQAAMSLARSILELPIEALDADPWALNCANGTLDLRTGELRPHRRADLLTRLAPVIYDPAARAERWRAFLERILPDPDVRAFVQRAVGYSLTGVTREHVLVLLWGGGNNGKTTFIETILAMLGDYASGTPAETLLAKRDTGIPNDVARLRGVRLAAAVESEEGRRLAEARVKQLTGGDTVTARHMRAEWFDFKPAFKLWLATNHRPQVRGTDEAIWRRIRLVPFTVTIPEDERDENLPDRLRAELPGILAWAVQGCLAWQRDGLKAPESVQLATADYRASEDVLGTFLEERCRLGEGWRVPRADLYANYRSWAEAAGEKPMSQKQLAAALRERGFRDGKTGKARTRVWLGLDLAVISEVADT